MMSTKGHPRSLPSLRRYANIRIAGINTHTGKGLREGVVAFVLKRHPFLDIATLQEVRNRRDAVHAFPPNWEIWPTPQEGNYSKGDYNNYVAFRSKRFRLLDYYEEDVTFNSKYDRAVRGVVLLDKRTRRTIFVDSLHPDPLGKGLANGDPGAVNRHMKQVQASADAHQSVVADLHASVGDVNERSTEQGLHVSATVQFGRVGMHNAVRVAKKVTGPRRLMVAFLTVNKGARVMWHKAYDTGVPGMDHEVTVTGWRIRRKGA